MDKGLLSTKEAARALGVNDSRVRQLILAGRLQAHKVGGAWVIRPAALRRYKTAAGRKERGLWPPGPRRIPLHLTALETYALIQHLDHVEMQGRGGAGDDPEEQKALERARGKLRRYYHQLVGT